MERDTIIEKEREKDNDKNNEKGFFESFEY
jgi:hypothetical protein